MKILFADDEPTLQEVMRLELPDYGHKVTICPDGTTAMAAVDKDNFDCLLIDLDMPGADGLEVIEYTRSRSPETDFVIMTGKGSIETAIEALHQGVYDYLRKPCKLADIQKVLQRLDEKRQLSRKLMAAENQLKRLEGGVRLVGESQAMQKVYHLIDRIAPTESTVIILGETGTGKELVARAVHDRSHRNNMPFVAINCGALPENLIESELFGHRKGSFTGAEEHRTGLFEVANEGTLFLDEIGELPKGVQSKLLRFLESGEIRRVGENNAIICNVRVVCATLRNLESMVRSGEFREDLWFRINTFEITLPPLRDKLEDLPELILHFTKRFQPGLELGDGTKLFTPEAMNCLENHLWPGNVRQLANVIEHSLILTDRIPIGLDSLPQPILKKMPPLDREEPNQNETIAFPAHAPIEEMLDFDEEGLGRNIFASKTLRSLEMEAIQDALARNENNKAKAAEELGISLKTLYNKLNQAGDVKKSA